MAGGTNFGARDPETDAYVCSQNNIIYNHEDVYSPKNSRRSCTEHYLELVAVSEECGGADNLIVDKIVHYADPAIRMSIILRLNLTWIDFPRQAEE